MSNKKKYVSLHTHSTYSPQDGLGHIRDMLYACNKKHISSLAITDHGNMNHFGDLYLQSREFGVKGIYGNEFYFVPDLSEMFEMKQQADTDENLTNQERKDLRRKTRKAYHITLVAKNKIGLKNLFTLTYLSYKDGFYYKPRIDRKLLQQYGEGIICTSGCIAGEIQQNIIGDNIILAKEAAKFYKKVFKEDFYLELQMNELEIQRKSNEGIILISDELKIPTVMTNDSHYVNQGDAQAQQTLLLLQSKATYGAKEAGKGFWEFGCKELFLKNYEDMEETYRKFAKEYMPKRVFLDSMDNTLVVDSKIEEIEVNTDPKLPELIEKPILHLIKLCKEGLKEKGVSKNKKYIDRLKFELDVINQKGFANYFLVCKEIISNAKKMMLVGPGRGSGAGSLVNYLLGITDIDPIRFDLYFERFLNIDRDDYPDIDTDFEDVDMIKNWIFDRFGEGNVALISTFGTFKMKNLIKDLARVYEVPLIEANVLCKTIDEYVDQIYPGENKSIVQLEYEDYYQKCPPFKVFMDKYHNIQRDFKVLHNQIRQTGTHAGGVIICDNLYEQMPTMVVKGKLQTGITEGLASKNLGKLGFIKFDVLGLSTLKIIHDASKLIAETNNRTKEDVLYEIHPDKIDLRVDAVYKEIFLKGRTAGIFQFMSDGMKKLLKQSNVDCFEDVTAITSLYRPGPLKSGLASSYGERKKHPESVKYVHPIVKSILQKTHGIQIYQEQMMALGNKLGGLTLAETNVLRKVIIKQTTNKDDKKYKIREELYTKFISGAVENGLTKVEAQSVWDDMEAFSGYGFNLSHAASYSMISYQTAYLKYYHPLEFYTALFNFAVDKSDDEKLHAYMKEAREFGVEILPPNINKSEKYFIIEDGKLRMGMLCVKGIGSKACETIVEARNKVDGFNTLESFFDSTDVKWRSVNKKVVICMIKFGFFDSIEKNRKRIEEAFIFLKEKGKKILKVNNSKFLAAYQKVDDVENYNELDMVQIENELLGFNFFLDPFLIRKRDKKIYLLERIKKAGFIEEANQNRRLAALIVSKKEHVDKSGNTMAFLRVKDRKGKEIDVTIFGSAYQYLEKETGVGNLCLLKVKKNVYEGKLSFIVNTGYDADQKEIKDCIYNIDDDRLVLWLKQGSYEKFN